MTEKTKSIGFKRNFVIELAKGQTKFIEEESNFGFESQFKSSGRQVVAMSPESRDHGATEERRR